MDKEVMPQGIIPAGDYPSETHRLEIIPDGVFPRPLAAVNAFGPRVRYGLGVGRSRALFYAPLSRFLAPSLALAAAKLRWRTDARLNQRNGKARGRPNPGVRRSFEARSRLNELHHEVVFRLRRVRYVLVARIVGVAKEMSFVHQSEPRRFDFLPKKCFLNAMQGAGFRDTGSGPARMVGDDVEASRRECAEDSPVHRGAIHAEMSKIVIVEHQGHEVDASRHEFGRNGIFKRPRDGNDRRRLDAGAAKIFVAFGQRDR